MNIKRFCQLLGATLVLSGATAITPAYAVEQQPNNYPLVENTVFEVIGDYLPMRGELHELQQQEPEIYNELIWELYDITESYKMTRIEAGLATADLYLQMDLKDLEAEWLAMEYLEVQSSQNSPATAEYAALHQVVEDMFDLEMQIRNLENEQFSGDLSAAQKAELSDWETTRLALRNEIIERELDEYLSAGAEYEHYQAKAE